MGGVYPHRCDACRRDQNLRQRWGCDAPAATPQYKEGDRWIYRCPNSQTDPVASLAARAWLEYWAGGQFCGPLPFAGGWLDQPAWVEAVWSACSQEWSKIQEHNRQSQAVRDGHK